jgi:hypothetical protein
MKPAAIPHVWLRLSASILLSGVMVAVAMHHEPWSDEAQAWLIARDSTPLHIVVHGIRYEGTPPLWHLLLWIPAQLGFPYWTLKLVGIAAALAGAALFALNPRVPTFLCILIPFTYFFAYQYSVISRSYCLFLPILGFLTYRHQEHPERPGPYSAALNALAWVSAHGAVLAVALLAERMHNLAKRWACLEPSVRRSHCWWLAGTGLSFALIGAMVWPPSDQNFIPILWTNAGFIHVVGFVAVSAFHRYILAGVLLLITSLFWFEHRGVLRLFLVGFGALGLFSALVYSAIWHTGLTFLFWAYCIWLGYQCSEASAPTWLSRAGSLAIVVVLVTQVWYTGRAYVFDINSPYSGSLETARFLQATLQPGDQVFGDGFRVVALQPYFKSNLFANYHGGAAPAYWLWTRGNELADGLSRLREVRPNLVVLTVGMRGTASSLAEARKQAADLEADGYRLMKVLEGHLTWFGYPLEEESYLVLERVRVEK